MLVIQWGATGYFEQNGLFIKVKLWKNQPGRVKQKTVTYLMLRYPVQGPGYGEKDQTRMEKKVQVKETTRRLNRW